MCLQISQESTCVGVFFKKVAGPQNFNFVKKRLHHRFTSREFSELFKSTYFAEDLWTAGSETSVLLYEKSFFSSGFFFSFRFPDCNFILQKRFWQRCLSVNFTKFSRISSDRAHPDDCICEFWEAFQITCYIGHLWKTVYFMQKLQDFNHKIQYKIFHKCFSSILYKNKK